MGNGCVYGLIWLPPALLGFLRGTKMSLSLLLIGISIQMSTSWVDFTRLSNVIYGTKLETKIFAS